MSKLSNVVATWTGVPKEAPPLVDLTTKTLLLPGRRPEAEDVAEGVGLDVVADRRAGRLSAPLTWIGVCQEPAGPVRRFMNAGSPLCQMA